MDSSVAMSEFKSQLNISYASFVDALLSVKAASKNLGLKTSISITIKQVGGTPASINSILSKQGVKDGFLYCNADNMDKCIGVANAIMEYIADDQSNNGYLYQLKKIDKAKTYSALKALGAVNIGSPSEIDSTSVVEGAIPPHDFYDQSQQLFNTYNSQAAVYSSAKNLSSLTTQGGNLNQSIQSIINIANQNMSTVERKLNDCMGEKGMTACNNNLTLQAYNSNDINPLSSFKSVGVLKNNFSQFSLHPWTSELPSNQSWILAITELAGRKQLLISGELGTQSNYIYQGVAPVISLGKRYDRQWFYAQDVDELNFNDHYYYLSYDQSAKDDWRLLAPGFGHNGLAYNSATIYLWDPNNNNGFGGLLSFNYHFIENNPDYVELIKNAQTI